MNVIDTLANCILNLIEDGLRLKGHEVERELCNGEALGTGDNTVEVTITNWNWLFKIAVCQHDNCEHCGSPANPIVEIIDEDHDVVWIEQADKVTIDKILTEIKKWQVKHKNPRG